MHYRAFRHPAFYDVQITAPSGRQSVKLVNVNIGGARVAGDIGFHPGDRVQVSVMNTRVDAHVRWTGGGRAGLSFRPQLSQRLVDQVTQRIGEQPTAQRFDSSSLQEMR